MKISTVRAYIGLGSNLDGPVARLTQAMYELDALPQTRLVAQSRLYASRPLADMDQPEYINAVAVLETRLLAWTLLKELQGVERRHGRIHNTERWAPRTLDLDILLYGDETIASPALQIPHPGLAERDFVIYPLYDLAPALHIPGQGALVDLLKNCPVRGLRVLAEAA